MRKVEGTTFDKDSVAAVAVVEEFETGTGAGSVAEN